MATKRVEGVVRDNLTGAGQGNVTVSVNKVSGGTVTSTTSDNAGDVGYYSRNHDTVGYPGPVYEQYTYGTTTKKRDGRVHGQLAGILWADDVNDVFAAHGIGVVPGVGGDLAVSASGVSMSPAVAAGMALLKDGLPYILEAASSVTLNASDPTNPRIDRIVLRLTREGQTDQGAIALTKITGTAAGSPAAPALTQTAATWDFSLAQVLVGAGVTTIAADKVTDERYSTSLNQAYAFSYPTGLRVGDLFSVDASGKLARLAIGSSSQYLKGGSVPAYGAIAAGDLPTAIDATKIADGSVTNAEFQFIGTVTSNVQTQLDAKQPLDTDLTAIAALASAADKMPYATGAGTWTLADLTAFARTLLDDANQAAMRTTLGLTPGTDVQAFDADLSALAALAATAGMLARTGAGAFAVRTLVSTSSGLVIINGDGAAGAPSFSLDAEIQALAALVSAADKLAYYTGSGTAALADFSAAGRALVDDADAAAQRTTLGLVAAGAGDIWVEKAGDTMTGALVISNNLTVTGDTDFGGNNAIGNQVADVNTIRGHFVLRGGAPSIAVGVALGTGGSVSASINFGNDQGGRLTLVSGTTSLTTGTAATITFNTARPDANYAIDLTPSGATAGANAVGFYAVPVNTTTWDIRFAVAPGASLTFTYCYTITETIAG